MSGNLPVIAVVAMLVLTALVTVPVAAAESVAVATEPPTDVTNDSATLQGHVSALEDADNATVWFEYWVEGDAENRSQTGTLTVNDTGPFSIEVLDLESDTTYTVVAHAETENASSVGAEVTFTTNATETVAVETGEASDITETAATLSGQLTEIEGVDNASVWFKYWEQGDPANTTRSVAQTLESPGTFTASVTGLANNTTYVFEAHAVTENDSDTGEQNEFTTFDRSADLVVETLAASEVGISSATLNGQLTGMNGEDEVDVRFEYWVKGDPANATTTGSQRMTAPGAFSEGVSGLQNDTTYVYVAHATANNTTVTGGQVEFTTATDTNETDGPVWDGQGPFGHWVSNLIQALGVDSEGSLGQQLSDLVVKNNPGSEQRSDKANPGGNGHGPPEHALNKSADKRNNSSGPPDHAANKSADNGNNSNGPPEHAKNDSDKSGNVTESGNQSSGNNGDNGPGNGNGNDGEDNGNGNDGEGNGNGNNGQGNGNNSMARDTF